MTKNVVLIVEDEMLDIELYKEMFAGRYDLLIAQTGEQAARIAAEENVDLILLDVMLPDTNGIELCRRLKGDTKLQHIPIIIITSLDTPEDKVHALQVGANDFLNKPVDSTELLLKVKNHLIILGQYKQIKIQNREINRFVEVMAHDFKNPLAVIMGYNELIAEKVGDESVKGYCYAVGRNSQRMLDSINEILDIRRIESSSFNIKLEEFDLPEQIADIAGEWIVLAKNKNITINFSFDSSVKTVIGDWEKFKDIFANLVSNALKYSPPNTAICVITENIPGDFVKITVKDQGLGLTEDDKERVFGEFQKLSARPTGSETSTGLGLSIVKRLVELMGGQVGVESEGHNKGSSFWFTLKKA